MPPHKIYLLLKVFPNAFLISDYGNYITLQQVIKDYEGAFDAFTFKLSLGDF